MTQDQAHMEMEKLAYPKHRAYTHYRDWVLPEGEKPFVVGIGPTVERQYAQGYGNTWEEAIADFKQRNAM